MSRHLLPYESPIFTLTPENQLDIILASGVEDIEEDGWYGDASLLDE